MSLSGTFNQTTPPPVLSPKRRREPPFSLRLSPDERARLAREAAGAPLGAYIKAKLLTGAAPPVRVRRSGLPVEDRQALAQTLARLGASRLSANLNQIAFAANSGSLSLTPETNKLLGQALFEIGEVRRLLLVALGLKDDGAAP